MRMAEIKSGTKRSNSILIIPKKALATAMSLQGRVNIGTGRGGGTRKHTVVIRR
jgi:hypothetical protein